LPAEPADAERPSAGPALQLKVRLLEVSPMVWRRLLVPVGAGSVWEGGGNSAPVRVSGGVVIGPVV
jgi:hypothetical protein